MILIFNWQKFNKILYKYKTQIIYIYQIIVHSRRNKKNVYIYRYVYLISLLMYRING